MLTKDEIAARVATVATALAADAPDSEKAAAVAMGELVGAVFVDIRRIADAQEKRLSLGL
jgi:hypothetical protein